jgi:uncharacterized protein YndB with AHSA1/START domain
MKNAPAKESTIVHGTFTVERTYPQAPAKVFAAFADPAKMRRWFAETKGFEVVSFDQDFKVGGRMRTRFLFPGHPDAPIPAGTPMGNDTVYLDIVPERRIVLAYSMNVNDTPFSASLATFELVPDGSGTLLVATEQGAYFENSDGPAMREQGWRDLLESLARELGNPSA